MPVSMPKGRLFFYTGDSDSAVFQKLSIGREPFLWGWRGVKEAVKKGLFGENVSFLRVGGNAPQSPTLFVKHLLKAKEKTAKVVEKFFNSPGFGKPGNGLPFLAAWHLSNERSLFLTGCGIPISAITHRNSLVGEQAVLAVRALGVHNLIIGSPEGEVEGVYLSGFLGGFGVLNGSLYGST